jgi:hypothetical protein
MESIEYLLIVMAIFVFFAVCFNTLYNVWEKATIRGYIAQIINLGLQIQFVEYGNEVRLRSADIEFLPGQNNKIDINVSIKVDGVDVDPNTNGIQIDINDSLINAICDNINNFLINSYHGKYHLKVLKINGVVACLNP